MNPIPDSSNSHIIQQISLIVRQPQASSVTRLRDLLQEATGQSREQSAEIADAIVHAAQLLEELKTTKLELAKVKERFKTTKQPKATRHPSNQAVRKPASRQAGREEILGRVFESADRATVIMDLQGKILDANSSFTKLTDMPLDSVLNRNLAEFVKWRHASVSKVVKLALSGQPSQSRVSLTNDKPSSGDGGEAVYWGSISVASDEFDLPTHLVAYLTDVSKMDATQKRLHRQALHDNLTKLPNRRFFRKRIDELIACPNEATKRFGVCFLDLDDFKIVNDTLGHDAGDQLLIEVAERIKGCIFRDCFLSRFGGDEFALIIPASKNSPFRPSKIANAVVQALNEPFTLGENQVYIGVSIGITYFPDDSCDARILLRHADVAMYHAKDEGKNTVRTFTPMLAAELEAGRQLLNDLRRAVANHELNVVYQPKLCLKSGKVRGCEALVRWTPDGIPVCPSDFIEAAEKSGLILPLSDQVMRSVLLQSKKWRQEGVFDEVISINISPRQISDPEFIGRFTNLLAETGTEAEWFELELTENAVMENLDHAILMMDQLKALGAQVAIDNFGTGYSSLRCLRTLPVSTLKIDLSFVHDLPNDPGSVAIARTILSLGDGLDLQVVAEGVETVDQLDFLREAGCDMVQGYLVSHPLAAEDFADFIQRSSD